MHVISGYLRFRPEDRDEVIAGLVEITELSRRDAGCVEYWWAPDLEQPDTFRFFEVWESAELFDAHRATAHEERFNERYLSQIIDADAHVYAVAGRRSAMAA
jgi:quinol monooxygenase YgiN